MSLFVLMDVPFINIVNGFFVSKIVTNNQHLLNLLLLLLKSNQKLDYFWVAQLFFFWNTRCGDEHEHKKFNFQRWLPQSFGAIEMLFSYSTWNLHWAEFNEIWDRLWAETWQSRFCAHQQNLFKYAFLGALYDWNAVTKLGNWL